MAERLLVAGHWIATNNSPLGEAEKLSDIADGFVKRIDVFEKKGNVRETEREVSRYTKVWDHGVNDCLKRVSQKGLDPESKKGFGEIQRHDEWQRQQFQQMFDRTKPDMKKFFEPWQNKGRPAFQGFKK